MNSRRFAVCLGIGLTVSFASVAIYVLTTRKYRRKKNEDEEDNIETQNFPFLTDDHCIKFIMNSKVMFIMRGLPGSGKSAVARQIKQVYSDLAVMCSVDDFREEVEECETRQHMMCQEKAKQVCQNGTPVVIIDNMNIKKTLLYDYIDIARSAGYYVVLVEPKTSWKYHDLALRNHHRISEEVLGELLAEFEQIIAVYYGWFLSENSSKALKDGLFGILNECCTKIPSFKDVHGNNSVQDEHECSISLQTSSETMLSSLSCLERPHDHLHITTFFNKRGKVQQSRANNYVSSPAVQDALGSVTILVIIAWTITPRTVTARVKLNSQQITLWNNLDSLDLEEGSCDVNTILHLEALRCLSQGSDSSFIPVSYNDLAIMPTIGKGDTAHITLSRRSDVTPVQGRYDLGDLIRLELTNHNYEEYKVTQGVARNYGDGQWAVYLNEPIRVNALFTGFY